MFPGWSETLTTYFLWKTWPANWQHGVPCFSHGSCHGSCHVYLPGAGHRPTNQPESHMGLFNISSQRVWKTERSWQTIGKNGNHWKMKMNIDEHFNISSQFAHSNITMSLPFHRHWKMETIGNPLRVPALAPRLRRGFLVFDLFQRLCHQERTAPAVPANVVPKMYVCIYLCVYVYIYIATYIYIYI